jgi:hypothetical protein
MRFVVIVAACAAWISAGCGGQHGGGGSGKSCVSGPEVLGTATMSGRLTGTITDAGIYMFNNVGASFPFSLLDGLLGTESCETVTYSAPSGATSNSFVLDLALRNAPTAKTYKSTDTDVCNGAALGVHTSSGGQLWRMEADGNCLLGSTGNPPIGSYTFTLSSVTPYDGGNGNEYYKVHGSLVGTMLPAVGTNADGGVSFSLTF